MFMTWSPLPSPPLTTYLELHTLGEQRLQCRPHWLSLAGVDPDLLHGHLGVQQGAITSAGDLDLDLDLPHQIRICFTGARVWNKE